MFHAPFQGGLSRTVLDSFMDATLETAYVAGCPKCMKLFIVPINRAN